MHQPDAVWLFHTTQAFTYRAQSPLAFRGQAKTRNIKARVEEGKIGAKRGREDRREGKKDAVLPPPMSLPLSVSGLRLGLRQTSWEAGSSTAW